MNQSDTGIDRRRKLFHNLLVSSNSPASWPVGLSVCVVSLPVLIPACAWFLVAGWLTALFVAGVLIFFLLLDTLVLLGVRHWRISFGPVTSQVLLFEMCRLVVLTAAAFTSRWLGVQPALGGAIVVNFLASVTLVWGAVVETYRPRLTRLHVTSDRLPHQAPPLRILHVSDLHVERWGRREDHLLHILRTVTPDLILLTGDYLNLSYVNDPVARADAHRLLAAMCGANGATPEPPGGVFAVLGTPAVDQHSASLFDGLPIRLLQDEVVNVGLEHERQLALLGLNCTHSPDVDGPKLAHLSTQVESGSCRVLLYHSPELMGYAPQSEVDVYLCGHTHGGQIRMPLYGALLTASRLGKSYDKGYYQRGRTHLYVSRGVGLEGMGAPRVRFLCPSEVTLITLSGDGTGPSSI